MALNIVEQQQIIQGKVSPTDTELRDLVKQQAIRFVIDFRNNIKDTTGNADAANYVNKIDQVNSQIFFYSYNFSVMVRILISILGGTTSTYASVAAAADTDWADFISNNISESIHLIANTSAAEKAAYDAI